MSGIQKRFNAEYAKLAKESLLLGLMAASRKNHFQGGSGDILIVNPCLIGEFAASMPAIYDFAARNSDKRIHLMTTKPLTEVAARIIGIDHAIPTASIYGRANEKAGEKAMQLAEFENVIVLRTSAAARQAVKAFKRGKMTTSFGVLLKYTFHLLKNLILGKAPRRWRSVNFDILQGVDRDIPFAEMFRFRPEDHKNLKQYEFLAGTRKKIVIHTGTNWPMKRWSNENWIRLLRKVRQLDDFELIFVGDGNDLDDYRDISSELDFPVHSLIGKTSLVELLLVLTKADYFIGVDSGPANLAHLVGLRSLTILGPGPHMYLPVDPEDAVIDKTGGRGLFQMFFAVRKSFIAKITAEEVFAAFQEQYRKREAKKRNGSRVPAGEEPAGTVPEACGSPGAKTRSSYRG